ncbi:MAG: aldo/keto reductase [Candidatus Latescibacterota bacterium]|nr:aldo/keto reductase [Candidatus Latescibacterota bacterium]
MTFPVVAFGSTNLQVSALGLGTVELGLPYGVDNAPPPSPTEATALIHRALEGGIRYFDTAAAYGSSEELLGAALVGRREEVVVCTKVTLPRTQEGKLCPDRLTEQIDISLAESRNKLRREQLELVLLHNAEAMDFTEELLTILESHCKSGVVCYWGASTYGREAPFAAIDHADIRCLQVAYNALDRALETDLFPLCRRREVALVLRSVFLQGVLSHRRNVLNGRFTSLRRAAQAAADIADEMGVDLPELALRFALFEAGAPITLVGTSSVFELAANVDAWHRGPLPADVVCRLREIEVDDPHLLNPANWKKS